jgi:hypothetical protein
MTKRAPTKKIRTPNSQVVLTGYQCRRCWHVWLPRVADRRPKYCPNCKSSLWQTDPVYPDRRPRTAGARPTPDRPKPPRKRA